MANKKIKLLKNYVIILSILSILWCAFYLFFFNYYTDAMDMVTVGAKKDIQILELFYYRGKSTVIVMVSYFLLISVHMLSIQYVKVRSFFEKDLSQFNKVNLAMLVLFSILSLINSFRVLFILLTIVSLTINFIIYTISKTKYTYINEEIIFEKSGLKSDKEAEELLKKYLLEKKKFFEEKNLYLFGEVIKEDCGTYKVELVVEEKE